MTPRYDLLPRGKSDDEAVERLRQLPLEELRPLLPHLAEWLEDLNWPVAGPVWRLLLPYAAELEPFVVEVLLHYDDIWKANLLRLLERSDLPALSPRLRELTERIAYSPTESERAEETDEAAHQLLARHARYRHLLPRHKGDDAVMEQLHQLPEAELLPLLPELLTCLADSSWPIAKAAWPLLQARLRQLPPAALDILILEVLADPDHTWKGNVLALLCLAELPALTPAIRQATEHLATAPTPGEQAEDADQAARDLLAKYA